jgi:hypothetical protein
MIQVTWTDKHGVSIPSLYSRIQELDWCRLHLGVPDPLMLVVRSSNVP